MSLYLVKTAFEIEKNDNFHLARLLLLLKNYSENDKMPLKGITKLAKLDFLLRYPNCLDRILKHLKVKGRFEIPENEINTIETRMIRFRYGPWDKRYRRWISLLVAKQLAITYLEKNTVNILLTEEGLKAAIKLIDLPEFFELNSRSNVICSVVGKFKATNLKNLIYEVFPEILNMKWGEKIEL